MIGYYLPTSPSLNLAFHLLFRQCSSSLSLSFCWNNTLPLFLGFGGDRRRQVDWQVPKCVLRARAWHQRLSNGFLLLNALPLPKSLLVLVEDLGIGQKSKVLGNRTGGWRNPHHSVVSHVFRKSMGRVPLWSSRWNFSLPRVSVLCKNNVSFGNSLSQRRHTNNKVEERTC